MPKEMNYYTKQLELLKPWPAKFKDWDFVVSVQFRSEHGKTNYMNLTPDQMRKIAEILKVD